MNIQVSPDRLGTFREDENGEIQPCPRLHQVIQRSRQTGSFRNGLLAVERLMQTYSHLFNITRNKLPPITWLVFFPPFSLKYFIVLIIPEQPCNRISIR